MVGEHQEAVAGLSRRGPVERAHLEHARATTGACAPGAHHSPKKVPVHSHRHHGGA